MNSPDGAHLGMTANQALGAVIGGEQPKPAKPDPREFEEYIMSAADEFRSPVPDGQDGYSEASRRLAKKMVLFARANPDALARPFEQRGEFVGGEYVPVGPKGFADVFMDAMNEQDRDESGGMTGFMWGWAYNATRRICELPPAPNPAIITIG